MPGLNLLGLNLLGRNLLGLNLLKRKLIMKLKHMNLATSPVRSSIKRMLVLLMFIPFFFVPQVKVSNTLPTFINSKLTSSSSSLLTVNDNNAFDSISCPSQNLCYISGVSGLGTGVVDLTTDSGNTFNSLESASSMGLINLINCPSQSVCYVTSEMQSTNTSELAITQNGGGSFNVLSNGPTDILNYTSLSCINNETCMFVGNNIYSNPAIELTSNQGTTFNSGSVPSGIAQITFVSCINSTTCVIAGLNSSSSPEAFETSNFGSSWTQILLPSSLGEITGFSCATNSECALVGNSVSSTATAEFINLTQQTVESVNVPSGIQTLNSVNCQLNGTATECVSVGQLANYQPAIILSSNLGNYSMQSTSSNSGLLESVSCSTTDFCGAIGKSGESNGLFSTYSNGTAEFTNVSDSLDNFNSLDCVNSTFCAATSTDQNAGSSLFFSTDFGGTYSQVLSEPGGVIVNGLSCPSSSECYVALNNTGTPNLIIVTNPSLTVTNIVLPSNIASISSLSCYSNSGCELIGSTTSAQPFIYLTSDSGTTWTQSSIPTSQATLTAISCLSNGNCSAIGTSITGTPTEIYSSNAGTSYSDGSIPTTALNLTSIDCFSTGSCIIIGEDQAGNPFIAVSADSGTTYTLASIAPSNNILKSISCNVDASGNLCVITALVPSNNSSFVYESNNSGANWIQLNQPAGNYPLNTVSCISSSVCLLTGGLYGQVSLALNPQPIISSLSPSSGPVQGGTTVTITGNFLTGTSSVLFGSVPAESFNVINDDEIEAVSPSSGSTSQSTIGVQVIAEGNSNSLNFTYLDIVYNPVNPFRICDTRAANGTSVISNQCDASGASPLVGNTILNVQVTGLGNPPIPSDATAVVVNLTATDTTQQGGFLTVYPTGSIQPTASNLNFGPDDTVANLVQVGIGNLGKISVYNFNGSTDIILDVEGYFAPSSFGTNSGGFVPLTPTRVCDTRSISFVNQCNQSNNGTPGSTALGSNSIINIQVSGGSYPVPSTASAVVANLTATDTTQEGGFLTAWPGGTTSMPNASNLNFGPNQSVANRIIIPINASTGDISVYNFNGTTDVILDVTGYFTSATSTMEGLGFNSIVPTRICDTRTVDVINVAYNQCNLNGPETLSSNQTLTVQVGGINNIPVGVTAVVANVTAVNTTQNGGFFTVYPTVVPTPTSPPNISDLNWNQGETIANLIEDGLGNNGSLNVYNYTGNADLIIDVTGYYS